MKHVADGGIRAVYWLAHIASTPLAELLDNVMGGRARDFSGANAVVVAAGMDMLLVLVLAVSRRTFPRYAEVLLWGTSSTVAIRALVRAMNAHLGDLGDSLITPAETLVVVIASCGCVR